MLHFWNHRVVWLEVVSSGYLVLPPAQGGAEFKAALGYANSDAPEINSGDCAHLQGWAFCNPSGKLFSQYIMILAMKIYSLILPMRIFLAALQPVSLVHSLYLHESGFIHYTVETTTTFPQSSHEFLNEHPPLPLSLLYSLFESYSSNYLTPCLLCITCTFSCPSSLTDPIELKMMAMVMKLFKGRQEEAHTERFMLSIQPQRWISWVWQKSSFVHEN